jgi:hypothetical protein
MSFDKLKANRSAAIGKLVAEAEKAGGGGQKKSYGDDREWKPQVDKTGNGYAVIRFLPVKDGDDLPWVRYWDHGFQGPTGRWYIEKSLTSIGKDDPVSEINSRLWNTGNEADKDTARARKRRLHYVSNILVVSDPANPENEGKVFLYKFGKKIFDKIMDLMQPQFQDETPVNPFDFWEGANFKLKIRNFEGYRNYDKSEFDSPAALFNGDEDRLREVYDKIYPLAEFTDESSYKSYDELKKKLIEILGAEEVNGTQVLTEPSAPTAPKVEEAPQITTEDTSTEVSDDDDDDDSLSYFAQLAKS